MPSPRNDNAALEEALTRGAAAMGEPLEAKAAATLARYLRLLERWNRAFNLTAVRAPRAMVARHVLDSLTVLPWVRGRRVLDVGSGAGLPGIPVAVARPVLRMTLLDSNGKKVRFLRQVSAELGLDNVAVTQARAEAHRSEAPYHTIVSRAFASLGGYLDAVAHLCGVGTRIVAMKGAYPHAELAALGQPWARVHSVVPVAVPGLDAERHLVVFDCDAAGPPVRV